MRKIAGYMSIAVSIIVVSPVSISAACDHTLTLEQALGIAIERNPLLIVARSAVDAASARVADAQSAYWPQFVATGRAGRYDDGWEQSQNSAELIHTKTKSVRTTEEDYSAYVLNVGVVQQIYDFGLSRNQLESTRNSLDSSKFELDDAIMALVRDVKYSYFEVLKNQRLVEINKEVLEVQQKHLERAHALFSQGMRPKIDVISGEAEVSRIRLNLIKARYALQIELAQMEILLGGPPMEENYTLINESIVPGVYDDLDSLIEQALKNRPDISSLTFQIKSAAAGLRAAKAGYWPTFNAEGAYTFSGTQLPLDKSWQAGVVLKWNLFNGFKTSARVCEAGADLRILQARLKHLKDLVTKEVTLARLAVEEAKENIITAKAGLKQATENLAIANGRYQAGLSDAVEYSDAQVLYTQARNVMVQAEYDLYKATAGLDYAAGINHPAVRKSTAADGP